ncbi:Phospholipase D [Tolypocladium paradoxum]|uniref:Phospholipase D n=1 Tax=Tolypocladium paradoxum TaxID=94208 RepID=A0A2S4KP93_9HYPO|nr:Phospholipase D [Tolypocladium paradoxum]
MAPISRILGSLWAAAVLITNSLLVQALPNEAPASVVAHDANVTDIASRDGCEPFYAIAHRVTMVYSVGDALDNGANALEMDMTAWMDQWYADHDGTPIGRGHTARTMFEAVAQERRDGKNVIFVWLDLKNPDYGDAGYTNSNIEALRNLVRDILEPVGVQVLYGFYYSQTSGRAYQVIRDGLNDNEALGVDGAADSVQNVFEAGGPANIKQRVLSEGVFSPWLDFSDCSGNGKSICSQLRRGAESGAFGKVFGWTIAEYSTKQANLFMSDACVDGLIYGFVSTQYYDHADTRFSLSILTNWLEENGDKRCMATVYDKPW